MGILAEKQYPGGAHKGPSNQGDGDKPCKCSNHSLILSVGHPNRVYSPGGGALKTNKNLITKGVVPDLLVTLLEFAQSFFHRKAMWDQRQGLDNVPKSGGEFNPSGSSWLWGGRGGGHPRLTSSPWTGIWADNGLGTLVTRSGEGKAFLPCTSRNCGGQ